MREKKAVSLSLSLSLSHEGQSCHFQMLSKSVVVMGVVGSNPDAQSKGKTVENVDQV